MVFEDTKSRGKPIVFLDKARPFTGGLCEGVERALADMRAGGCNSGASQVGQAGEERGPEFRQLGGPQS